MTSNRDKFIGILSTVFAFFLFFVFFLFEIMVAVDEESQPFMGQNEKKIKRNRLFIFTASVIMFMFISATASLPFKRVAIDIYSGKKRERDSLTAII